MAEYEYSNKSAFSPILSAAFTVSVPLGILFGAANVSVIIPAIGFITAILLLIAYVALPFWMMFNRLGCRGWLLAMAFGATMMTLLSSYLAHKEPYLMGLPIIMAPLGSLFALLVWRKAYRPEGSAHSAASDEAEEAWPAGYDWMKQRFSPDEKA